MSFYTLPTAVAFYVLAEPILAVIYQHGAFKAVDTQATAVALKYYAIGLLFYSAVKVVVPVFYALKLARVAVLATIASVSASLLLNITLHPHYGYRVLALSTSVAAAVNLLVLLSVFLRRYGGLLQSAAVLALLRMGVAAAVMGLVLWALEPLCLGAAMHASGLAPGPDRVPLWRAGFGLGLLCALGGLAYGALCGLMQVEEVGEVVNAVRRRVNR